MNNRSIGIIKKGDVMYESKHHPLLSLSHFYLRLLLHWLSALTLFAGSLLMGCFGLIYFEECHWHDALLNAALLLGGFGPANFPLTAGGKLFISGFGLYSGLMFVGIASLALAPIVHRLLHRFHLGEP